MGKTGDWVRVGTELRVRNLKKGEKPLGYEAKRKFTLFGYQIGLVEVWEERHKW